MSTIKSSAENLTLNADGANNDIKFQSNGVEKASIDQDGKVTAGGASLDGAVVINDTGADVDFRVESDTDANSLFVQGSDGMVGIGTGTPTYTLDVDSASANVARFKPITGNRSLDITSADNGAYEGAVWTRDINSAGGIHIWSTNGGERLRIQAGGGISFNGDTAAANALDDYEEGTWTPNVTPNAGSITSVAVTGIYTKIGNIVHVGARLVFSNYGSASGGLNITNLPIVPTVNSAVIGHRETTGEYNGGGVVSTNGYMYNYVTWANHTYIFSATYRA